MIPSNDEVLAERSVARDTAQRFGSFSFRFADQAWEWSDDVARMHGYAPGTVVPDTALILRHKHPDDELAVAEKVRQSLDTGEPFSSRHRIIDTAGQIHNIIVVADHMFDELGAVIGTEGFYIDITDAINDEVRTSIDGFLSDFVESREAIDRAKGVIMFVYGISSQQAFDILKWRSQETNMKLRDIARQLLTDVQDEAGALVPNESRARFDHILLTTHTRIKIDGPAPAD